MDGRYETQIDKYILRIYNVYIPYRGMLALQQDCAINYFLGLIFYTTKNTEVSGIPID